MGHSKRALSSSHSDVEEGTEYLRKERFLMYQVIDTRGTERDTDKGQTRFDPDHTRLEEGTICTLGPLIN